MLRSDILYFNVSDTVIYPFQQFSVSYNGMMPQLTALFFALLDLTLDLRHANLGWTNELAPIKQSMPVAVAVFGSFGYSIVLAGLYLLLTPPFGAAAYLWCFAAVTAAAALILYLWLRRKGGKLFMEL